MEVVTLRIEENTLEALDEEKSQYGFSNRTEYIRFLIENRDVIVSNTLAVDDDDVQQRLDELEERVADLEANDEETSSSSSNVDPHAFGNLADEAVQEDVVDDRRDDQDGDPLREEMLDVLDDIDIPGRKAAVERTRREAVVAAWDRLCEEETIKTRDLANDIFAQFFENEHLGYSTSARYPGFGLWDNCVRDALKELPGVESPGRRGNTWRFRPEN